MHKGAGTSAHGSYALWQVSKLCSWLVGQHDGYSIHKLEDQAGQAGTHPIRTDGDAHDFQGAGQTMLLQPGAVTYKQLQTQARS